MCVRACVRACVCLPNSRHAFVCARAKCVCMHECAFTLFLMSMTGEAGIDTGPQYFFPVHVPVNKDNVN